MASKPNKRSPQPLDSYLFTVLYNVFVYFEHMERSWKERHNVVFTEWEHKYCMVSGRIWPMTRDTLHLATFYEDDILLFLLGYLHILGVEGKSANYHFLKLAFLCLQCYSNKLSLANITGILKKPHYYSKRDCLSRSKGGKKIASIDRNLYEPLTSFFRMHLVPKKYFQKLLQLVDRKNLHYCHKTGAR
jgi:hypothetical protein